MRDFRSGPKHEHTNARLTVLAAVVILFGASSAVAGAAPGKTTDTLPPFTPGAGDTMTSPASGSVQTGTPPTAGSAGKVASGPSASPVPKVTTTCKGSVCVTRNGFYISRVCKTVKKVKTCTFYGSNGSAYQRCVTTRGRTKCQATRSVLYGRTSTAAATYTAGFPSTLMSSVGMLINFYNFNLPNGRQAMSTCTGTVMMATLVLTAGHCVFNPEYKQYPATIYFVPAMTWASDGSQNFNTPSYGIWKATRWWVPNGFVTGDFGLDSGIVEVNATNAAGQALGDVTGAFSAEWNLGYTTNTRIYIVGYPGAGYWSTAQGHWGFGQYACDTSYGGFEAVGAGYDLLAQCPMNQGASGGPWFVQDASGQWVIGATSSFCSGGGSANGLACQPYGTGMKGLYFNENFQQFWTSVVGLLGYSPRFPG